MSQTLYQVDAFTQKPFAGNPAAICPLDSWLPDATMQAIAAENNLAESEFFVPEGDGFHLLWFTPEAVVDPYFTLWRPPPGVRRLRLPMMKINQDDPNFAFYSRWAALLYRHVMGE